MRQIGTLQSLHFPEKQKFANPNVFHVVAGRVEVAVESPAVLDTNDDLVITIANAANAKVHVQLIGASATPAEPQAVIDWTGWINLGAATVIAVGTINDLTNINGFVAPVVANVAGNTVSLTFTRNVDIAGNVRMIGFVEVVYSTVEVDESDITLSVVVNA